MVSSKLTREGERDRDRTLVSVWSLVVKSEWIRTAEVEAVKKILERFSICAIEIETATSPHRISGA